MGTPGRPSKKYILYLKNEKKNKKFIWDLSNRICRLNSNDKKLLEHQIYQSK
jgi:hypothetical protein